jgi:hypothetical protein
MSQEPKKDEGLWAPLLLELMTFIPEGMRKMIGFHFGYNLLIIVPAVVLISGVSLIKWYQAPTTSCWVIQKIEDRLFKLNSCTGETVELPPSPEASSRTP